MKVSELRADQQRSGYFLSQDLVGPDGNEYFVVVNADGTYDFVNYASPPDESLNNLTALELACLIAPMKELTP